MSSIPNKEPLLKVAQYLSSIDSPKPATVFILVHHWGELTISSPSFLQTSNLPL